MDIPGYRVAQEFLPSGRMWQEDVPGNIKKADANWPRLRDQ
jgi:hypothetical protein